MGYTDKFGIYHVGDNPLMDNDRDDRFVFKPVIMDFNKSQRDNYDGGVFNAGRMILPPERPAVRYDPIRPDYIGNQIAQQLNCRAPTEGPPIPGLG